MQEFVRVKSELQDEIQHLKERGQDRSVVELRLQLQDALKNIQHLEISLSDATRLATDNATWAKSLQAEIVSLKDQMATYDNIESSSKRRRFHAHEGDNVNPLEDTLRIDSRKDDVENTLAMVSRQLHGIFNIL